MSERRRGRVSGETLMLVTKRACVALVGCALLTLAGCGRQTLPLNTLDPEGRAGKYIDKLANPVFAVAGIVFLLVNLGVLFIAIKFRRRDNEQDEFPEQIHGNTKLELTWTILPGVVLAVIAVFTLLTLVKLSNTPSDAELTVKVEGQQWWWSYHYDLNKNGKFDDPEDLVTATELVIPTGQAVALKITSNDVIHSFWIPKLNGKKDAVPGRIHDWWIEADKPGYFLGQCTEFCGLSHAYMRMAVRAVPEGDFDQWVNSQLKPAELPADPAAQRGLAVFTSQCAQCHQIRGVNTTGCEPAKLDTTTTTAKPGAPTTTAFFDTAKDCYTGISEGWTKAAQISGNAPNLTHLMSRERFIGGLYNLWNDDGTPNRNTIEAWIRNPTEFKPNAATPTRGSKLGRGMPKLPLTDDQIDDVVSYLLTLK